MTAIHKYGDVREDGRVFVATQFKNGRAYEYWASPEAWEKIVNRNRENAARWRAGNPDKAKVGAKRFIENRSNKDRSEEYARMSKDSKDKATSRQALWRKNNRQKCVAATMRHRRIHKSECEEYRRKYCKLHAGRLNAYNALQKSKARGAVDPGINISVVSIIYQAVERIQKCTGIPHDVDHKIPISKGGVHHQSNLQILTHRLNMKKKDAITSNPIYFPAFNEITNT